MVLAGHSLFGEEVAAILKIDTHHPVEAGLSLIHI